MAKKRYLSRCVNRFTGFTCFFLISYSLPCRRYGEVRRSLQERLPNQAQAAKACSTGRSNQQPSAAACSVASEGRPWLVSCGAESKGSAAVLLVSFIDADLGS